MIPERFGLPFVTVNFGLIDRDYVIFFGGIRKDRHSYVKITAIQDVTEEEDGWKSITYKTIIRTFFCTLTIMDSSFPFGSEVSGLQTSTFRISREEWIFNLFGGWYSKVRPMSAAIAPANILVLR